MEYLLRSEQKVVLGSSSVEETKTREQPQHLLIELESFPYSVILSEESVSYCIGIVDMVNSTQLAARLGMAQMSKYYQHFLNFMSKIVEQYGGRVVKNIGDCLLFYFPKTIAQDRQEIEKILECAHTMTESRSTLCSQMKLAGLPCVDYRVSLDYGEVMPMKSTDSKSLDMIGPAVNMCSKINRCAQRNEFVVGGDMYEVAKHSEKFDFKEVKGISVGLKHCYPVYSVTRR